MKNQELINKIQSLEKEKRNLLAANDAYLKAFRAIGAGMGGDESALLQAYEKLIEVVRNGQINTQSASACEVSCDPDVAAQTNL